MNIAIISGSVRTGRNSHRVALFFKKYIESQQLASAAILDLYDYQFPVFEERLKFQKNPSPQTLDFAQKIKEDELRLAGGSTIFDINQFDETDDFSVLDDIFGTSATTVGAFNADDWLK